MRFLIKKFHKKQNMDRLVSGKIITTITIPFGCLGSSLFRHLLQFPIMGSLIKTVGGAGLELRHLA